LTEESKQSQRIIDKHKLSPAVIMLCGELLSSLCVIRSISIHTSLCLDCLVIKMWIVECESYVTFRLLCYPADENINT